MISTKVQPFVMGVKGFSVIHPSLMGSPPLPRHARLFSHKHFYFPFLDFCFLFSVVSLFSILVW